MAPAVVLRDASEGRLRRHVRQRFRHVRRRLRKLPITAQEEDMEEPNAAITDFELDVTLVEVADPASMVNLTDDGCGSTCGACTTGVH